MATTNYKVLSDELTVHKKVGDLIDPITKTLIGVQQGAGKTYFKDEVIPGHLVSPLIQDALEDEDHPSHASMIKKLAPVSDKPQEDVGVRSGVPFAGYEDMDEEAIIATMAVFPSSTIRAIQRYEADNANRDRIIHYSIGNAQSPTDRAEGRAGSQLQAADTDKEVAKLTTREVTEDGVQIGDGITGTGDPEIPHGSRSEENGNSDGESGDSEKADKPAAARQRTRRARNK